MVALAVADSGASVTRGVQIDETARNTGPSIHCDTGGMGWEMRIPEWAREPSVNGYAGHN